MQVCGAKCAACSNKIFYQDEGTWCGRCKTIFHRECERKISQCPKCNQAILDPATLFVRSKRCPECLAYNETMADKCYVCGASTVWDTEADYLARKTEIRYAAKSAVIAGALEYALAGILIVFSFVVTLGGGLGRGIMVLPIGLIADGSRRIATQGKFKSFE